jgi:uncharacterized protein GlcG (DUF336 family)
MQTIRTLGHEDAQAAIESIRSTLAGRKQHAVIAVADAYGETIGLLRMDGSLLSSVTVAINKAFTAARLRRPSRPAGAYRRRGRGRGGRERIVGGRGRRAGRAGRGRRAS